ncbi:hypothetical protein OAR19_00070 [bacterium]|nr:hypothetical protein [bacterium]
MNIFNRKLMEDYDKVPRDLANIDRKEIRSRIISCCEKIPGLDLTYMGLAESIFDNLNKYSPWSLIQTIKKCPSCKM